VTLRVLVGKRWVERMVPVVAIAAAVGVSPVKADGGPDGDAATEASSLDRVTVVGQRLDARDRPVDTGSRLGLAQHEVPAALDVLDQEDLLARGVRSSIEALMLSPGVTAADLPSSPGTASMRGFSAGAISLLVDGTRQTASTLITRDLDPWAFERIEVLKGPASVLYGEGALAGAINLVPKRAQPGLTAWSGLLSAGSFGQSRVALDGNLDLSETTALRLVASHRTGGRDADDSDSRMLAASASLAWLPSDDLRVDLAFDHQEDDYDTAYWGAPLVPVAIARDPSGLVRDGRNGYVVDRAQRRTNYNVDDAVQMSKSDWLRGRVQWRIGDTWRFTGDAALYDAERRWHNAETFTYVPATGLLSRTSTRIEHDHRFWTVRGALAADAMLGSLRNRFGAGVEFNRNRFSNPRQFATVAAVDPNAPVRGVFPYGQGAENVFHSDVQVASLFVEDALNLREGWLLVAGLRYDRIDLDRRINAGAPFGRRYSPLSWRVGTTVDLAKQVQAYAQVSEASAPVGSMLLLSLANSRFDLTSGRAYDAGLKASFLDGRLDANLAAYLIRQDDIVTRDPANPALSVQGGRQSSRGIEASLGARIGERLRVDASFAALDARFDALIEAGGANRRGNTPPNVPERIASLFASYGFERLPITVSVGARHAGRFYTDNANLYRVDGHTTVDASLAYRFANGELTLRGRNLGDAFYAEWAGGASDQFLLGAPRRAELEWRMRF
jgi:iron complex outermembrane receptor protein